MSTITISTRGLKIQFYCSHCCDDDEYADDENWVVMEFYRFEQEGRPECQICGRNMSADFIMLPPSEKPQINHI